MLRRDLWHHGGRVRTRHASRRRVRLGRRRPHRAPRAAGLTAQRGLRLPRRHGPLPVRRAKQAELQAFAVEIADHLLEAGAKLLVVACNSASSAALDALERHLEATAVRDVDVIGVVRPPPSSPSQAAATDASGCSRRRRPWPAAPTSAPWAADRHVHVEASPVPTSRRSSRAARRSRGIVDTVRGYCAPLRAAEVDTVILGCTHYPLVAPMLQRILGRGVTLVTSGAGVARSVERALAARELLNPRRTRAATASMHRRRRRLPGARDALPADAARRWSIRVELRRRTLVSSH